MDLKQSSALEGGMWYTLDRKDFLESNEKDRSEGSEGKGRVRKRAKYTLKACEVKR